MHNGLRQLSVKILNHRLDAVLVADQRHQALDRFREGGPVGVEGAEELCEAASVEKVSETSHDH